ncbi:hypothetical protein ACFLTH_07830 [Bacteroidota bacterium]
MELVPIIYLAIIIFSLFTIIAIIISYIFSKIKEKNDLEYEENNKPILILQHDINIPEGTEQFKPGPKRKLKPENKREFYEQGVIRKPPDLNPKTDPDPLKNNKRMKILNKMKIDESSSECDVNSKTENEKIFSVTYAAQKYSKENNDFYILETSKMRKQ